MTQTPNYNLKKPDYTDNVDVADLNDNADIIDSTLAAKANLVGGKVPASELPSYVDDVVEGYYYNGAFYSDSGHTTPITGETGKIYIDLDTESCYRWSGSVYVKISSASDALYVEFTESSGVYSCDTGLADMYDALDEGREVIGVYDNSGVQEKYYVGNYSEFGDYVTFYSYNSTGKIAELFGTGSGAETWSYDEFSLTGGGGGQLPTATNLGDVPSWNPGTQLWEITHKGTITSGSTGYATGGDVYTAIGNIPQIPVGTNTGDMLVWNGSAWVAKQPSRLPSAYQEVEYIESSGTQYIDTGIKASPTIRTVNKISFTDLSRYSLEGITETTFFWTWGITARLDYFETRVGNSGASWIASTIPTDTQIHIFDIASGSQKIDNIEYATGVVTTTSSNTVILFARVKDYGVIDEFSLNKCYDFKAYNGNKLIMHLIPCYERQSEEIGMFDIVNFKFYTNSGTGTFTKGADVN